MKDPTIPPRIARARLFPWRLAVLCYGISVAAHGGFLGWLAMTPVPENSAWASQSAPAPSGRPKPVKVTLMMTMTNFAQDRAASQPTGLNTTPSDTPPTPTAEAIPPKPKPAQTEPDSDPNRAPSNPTPTQQHATEQSPAQRHTPATEITPADTAATQGDQPDAEPKPNPVEPDRQAQRMEDAEREADTDTEQLEQVDTPNPQPSTSDEEPEVETETEAESPNALNENPQAAEPQPTIEPAESAEQNPPTQAEAQPDPAEPAEAMPATDEPERSNPPDDAQDAADGESVEAADEDSAESAAVPDEHRVDQPITFEKKVRPRPSALSRRMKETGTVVIQIEVDDQGRLVDYTVLDDAGKPRLKEAAIQALEKSTFLPAKIADKPVRSTRKIEYQF